MFDRYRHATRSVHAKSHGLLRADLTVHAGLAAGAGPGPVRHPADAAGHRPLLHQPRRRAGRTASPHPAGWPSRWSASTGRCCPRTRATSPRTWVCVNAKTFLAPDAEHFMKSQKIILANANDPEIFKKAVSGVAAGTNALPSGWSDCTAPRWSSWAPRTPTRSARPSAPRPPFDTASYVAKIAITPKSANLLALKRQAHRRRLPLLRPEGCHRRVSSRPNGPSGRCRCNCVHGHREDADRGPVRRVARGP